MGFWGWGLGRAASGAFDVWVCYADGMIGHLADISAGGGTFTQLDAWKTSYDADYNAVGGVVPGPGSKIMLGSQDGFSPQFPPGMQLFQSTDDAASFPSPTYSNTDDWSLAVMDGDALNPNLAWQLADLLYAMAVYYTTDGGDSWTEIRPVLDQEFRSIFGTWLGAARGQSFAYAVTTFRNGIPSDHSETNVAKVLSDGTFTLKVIQTDTYSADKFNAPFYNSLQNDGSVDPADSNRVCFIGTDEDDFRKYLFTLDWSAGTISVQTLPVDTPASDIAGSVIITSTGAILVSVDTAGSSSYFLRSTDHGSTWTKIDLAGLSGSDMDLRDVPITESASTIVIPLSTSSPFSGQFLFSATDGGGWDISGAIGYTGSDPVSIRARG